MLFLPMEVFLFVSIAFIPACFWLFYGHKKGIVSITEPLSLFLLALGCVFFVSICQTLIFPYLLNLLGVQNTIFFSAFIEAGFIESSLKLICLAGIPYFRQKDAKPRKVFFIAVLFALFFAGFETLAYSLAFTKQLVIIRLFTAYLVHVSGIIWISALFIKFLKKRQKRLVFGSLVFLHGFYDFCMDLSGFFVFGALLAEVTLLAGAFLILKKNPKGDCDEV